MKYTVNKETKTVELLDGVFTTKELLDLIEQFEGYSFSVFSPKIEKKGMVVGAAYVSVIGSIEHNQMTTKDIEKGFVKFVRTNKKSNFVFPNIYLGNFECDILEITKSMYAYEYEVKISVSDFKADAKKKGKFDMPRTNYFYYIVPKDLISVDMLPDYAGLIYCETITCGYNTKERGEYSVDKIYFDIVKSAPKLKKEKFEETRFKYLLEKVYYRFINKYIE